MPEPVATGRGDRHGAGVAPAGDPAEIEEASAQESPDPAGRMQTPLAPIETLIVRRTIGLLAPGAAEGLE